MNDADGCYIIQCEHGASAYCLAGANPAALKRFFRKHGKRNCKLVTVGEARSLAQQYKQWRDYGQPIPGREPDGQFHSFENWVCKATSWIGGENALCVDAKDRICRNGGDMQRARDERAFPVRFYYGAGGETPAEHRKSQRTALAAMRLQYPWRFK